MSDDALVSSANESRQEAKLLPCERSERTSESAGEACGLLWWGCDAQLGGLGDGNHNEIESVP